MHYRTHCCGEHEPIKLSKEDDNLSRLIEVYLRQLFDDRAVSSENQKKLWEYYYKKFSKGVDLGYNSKSELFNPTLASSFKYNVAEFAKFKEASFRKQLELALHNDGKNITWNEFKTKAEALSLNYNKKWLETEYQQAVASANMAEKWQNFEADADVYPNLKYIAVNDKRTREQHKSWDGLILPLTHTFWDSHLPPNDHGCRCNVEQTDDEPSREVPNINVKKEFANNPAKTGKIFNGNAYEKGMTQKEINEVKKSTRNSFNEKNPVTLDRYNKIDFEKQKGIKNGGILEKYTTGSQNKNEEKLNFETFKKLANKGYKYRMLPVLNDGRNNPDGYNLISNVFSDIKNAVSNNGMNVLQNALKEANKQSVSELIVSLTNKLTNNVDIYKAIISTIKQKRALNIQKILILFSNGDLKEYDLQKIRERFIKKG